MQQQPQISPLKLHRLGLRDGDVDAQHTASASLSGGVGVAQSVTRPLSMRSASAAADGEAGAEVVRRGSEAALALGAAPLSGFRSGRFTPREHHCWTPHSARGARASHEGGAPLQPLAETAAADAPAAAASFRPFQVRVPGSAATLAAELGAAASAVAGSPRETREEASAHHPASHRAARVTEAAPDANEEAASAAACGELRVFFLRGPPLPTEDGGVGLHCLPRSYWDACTLAASADGAPACWPAAAAPPEHLKFFSFPASLLERLRLAKPTDGAPDGFGFTFSFTASDGAVRYACAVTGVDGGGPAGALVAVSAVVLCDWPVIRPMLDVAKGLFLLHQSQPLGRHALSTHARQFAHALAHSDPEVTFLMQHPLWLPTPLAPLLEATRAGPASAGASTDTLLLVFLAALLERPLLLVTSLIHKLMPTAAALAHLLSPLSYSGTFIPLLPAALHPDPATLVNCSPTPFIIGVERHSVAQLQPLADHVVVFDLDDGSLSGEEVAPTPTLSPEPSPLSQRSHPNPQPDPNILTATPTLRASPLRRGGGARAAGARRRAGAAQALGGARAARAEQPPRASRGRACPAGRLPRLHARAPLDDHPAAAPSLRRPYGRAARRRVRHCHRALARHLAGKRCFRLPCASHELPMSSP